MKNIGDTITFDNLKYQIIGNNELKLLGFQFKQKTAIIPQCIEEDGIVYFVTKIGKAAFRKIGTRDIGLSSIEIPNTIKVIEEEAFFKSDLGKIKIPKSVERIEGKAFAESKLRLISFEEESKLETIEFAAFVFCTGLDNVDMSSLNLELIGRSCFSNCKSLSKIILPKNLTSISESCFNNCLKLTSIDLTDTLVESLEKYCFEKCSKLENVTLPSTLTKIDDFVFRGCVFLSKVIISSDVTISKSSELRPNMIEKVDGISGNNRKNQKHSLEKTNIIYKDMIINGIVNIDKLLSFADFDLYKEYIEKECSYHEKYLNFLKNKEYQNAIDLLYLVDCNIEKYAIKTGTFMNFGGVVVTEHKKADIIIEIRKNGDLEKLNEIDLSHFFVFNVGGNNERRFLGKKYQHGEYAVKEVIPGSDRYVSMKFDVNCKRILNFEEVIELSDVRFFEEYLKYSNENITSIFNKVYKRYSHRKDILKLLIENGAEMPQLSESEIRQKIQQEYQEKLKKEILNS